MQKFANSIFTSAAYHDRMITMFCPLNHFSIEAEIERQDFQIGGLVSRSIWTGYQLRKSRRGLA